VRTSHIFRPLRAQRGPAAIALLLASFAASPALAQNATQGEAEVIVLRPLSFFKVNDLDFGSIIASGTAGTVRLQPDGTRTRTGGATLAGNDGEPARFAGLGTPNRQVNISLGANSIFITGPGTRMRVRDFEIGSTPTAILSTTPTRFTITSALGNYNFPVGATLEVGANQTPGDYSGTFTITLNYL
jgi:spore coat protein U-like protein